MPWNRVSPGRYERPCDISESFQKASSSIISKSHNRQHGTINATARISVSKSAIELLPLAWLHTRHHVPMIACLVADGTLSYEVPDKATQANWVAETCLVERGTVDEFLLRAESARYCTLHYLPRSGELVVRMHRWLVDEIGALAVLDVLLEWLAETKPVPTFGDEWKRLPPSQHDAAAFPESITSEIESHAAEIFQRFALNLPALSLQIDNPTEEQPIGEIKRLVHGISKSTSATLKDACNRLGITVPAAVEAAIVIATQKNSTPETRGRNFTHYASISLRPALKAPYNDHRAWPAGYYLAGMPYSLPPGDLGTQAKAFREIYRQLIEEGKGPIFEAYETYLKMLLGRLEDGTLESISHSTTPSLNSLGKVDETLVGKEYPGKYPVELRAVDVSVDQMIPELRLYAWSFREQIFVSVVWNEVFYRKGHVQRFLKRILEVLSEELGVEII